VTRDLARAILEDEEKHIDFIETQFELIQRMGIENYVQLQSEGAED
jgi:bacterioferritin